MVIRVTGPCVALQPFWSGMYVQPLDHSLGTAGPGRGLTRAMLELPVYGGERGKRQGEASGTGEPD